MRLESLERLCPDTATASAVVSRYLGALCGPLGFAALLDSLGFPVDRGEVEPWILSSEYFGAWGGTVDSEDGASWLVVSADFARYDLTEDSADGDPAALVFELAVVLGRRVVGQSRAHDRATEAWRACRNESPVPYPDSQMPAEPRVVLLQAEHRGYQLEKGVWVCLRSGPIPTPQLQESADALLDLVRDQLVGLRPEFERAVSLVQGAVYAKPRLNRDVVTGWLGELAVSQGRRQLRWSPSWWAPFDLQTEDQAKVVEVKSSIGDGSGGIRLSPPEVAEAVGRRAGYELVRVRGVPRDLVDEVYRALQNARLGVRPDHPELDGSDRRALDRLGQATGLGERALLLGSLMPRIRETLASDSVRVSAPNEDPLAWLLDRDPSIGQELIRRGVALEMAL